MNIIDIIDKKSKAERLSKEEIEYFVKGYTENIIPDYQAAALVMAIKINGMDEEEVFNLTVSMAESGDILDLSDISDNIYDKHSTGGVGDKVTIAIIPIMASLGLNIAKMSGRGLGYTGGTADKFCAIPNFKMDISIEKFKEEIKEIGCAIMEPNKNVAPADKKIYALRDTIACTDSIPLIASSIISKKIASGANNIILEITYGSGAFMKTEEDAKKLKKVMEEICKKCGLKVYSTLVDMNQPLGYCVGNSLEVMEAIEFLNGKNNPELEKAVCDIFKVIGIKKDAVLSEISEKRAFKKFEELVASQGGDLESFYGIFKKENGPENEICICSKKAGKIKNIDALKIAKSSYMLGSGRSKKEDDIDYFSGVKLLKKVGEDIQEGDEIAKVYVGSYFKKKISKNKELSNNISEALELVIDAFEIV